MKSIDQHSAKLKEISDAAFSYAFDSIGIEKCQSEMSNPSKEFTEKYIIDCHNGFKIAQRLLIKEIAYYQTLLREKRKEVKDARRLKKKEKGITINQEIKVIEQRLHSFSHIADGIAWQLMQYCINNKGNGKRLRIGAANGFNISHLYCYIIYYMFLHVRQLCNGRFTRYTRL